MTHPQVEQIIQRVDDSLVGYVPAWYHDSIRDLEKKTGQPKAYFFFATVLAIFSITYGVGGMKLISDVMGFAYPAYMSFKAVESSDPTDDTQWLTYWVVFALFSIVENAMGFLVSWVPFYFCIKILFFAWLYHPRFLGAGLLYKQGIKPFVVPYLQAFEETKPQKKEE